MIRTLAFFSVLWLSLILSILFIIPLIIISFPGNTYLIRRYLHTISSGWAKSVLFISGVKVKKNCHGEFPFPPDYVIVANHQGYFDVLLILSTMPVTPSFISKIELKNIFLLNIWMKAMDCLFIDRSDSKGSRKKILQRLREKNKNPLILFPEGTRSRTKNLLPLKTGGLKMIYESGTNVIPVKIKGTFKLWEEKKRITPGIVEIEIFPVMLAGDYKKQKFLFFIEKIRRYLSVS